MATYKFVSSFNEPVDDNYNISFYQLSSFPDPKHKTYHLRKFIIDNNNNTFVDVKDYRLKKRQFEKFLKRKRGNEYKTYSVYDLDVVGYPTLSDILLLKSDILSTNHDYSGFAPF